MSRLKFTKSKALETTQHNYIDVQQHVDSGRVLAANQTYTVDLDPFHHESAFLWFCFRRMDQGDSNLAALNYVPLGPRATIDHINTHGKSLFGDGTPVDGQYWRRFINTQCWPHKFAKYNAVYLLPFSNDVASVFNGEIDGWHRFRGDRERIRFYTGNAPTETAYTLTSFDGSGATAAPSWTRARVWYKGNNLTPVHNAVTNTTTFGELEDILNASPCVISDNLEFRIERDVGEAGPGFVITAANYFTVRLYERGTYNATNNVGQPYIRKGDEDGMIHIEPLPTDPANNADFYAQPNTPATQGIPGFVEGTYQIDIYSVYYRSIKQHMGRLEVTDL